MCGVYVQETLQWSGVTSTSSWLIDVVSCLRAATTGCWARTQSVWCDYSVKHGSVAISRPPAGYCRRQRPSTGVPGGAGHGLPRPLYGGRSVTTIDRAPSPPPAVASTFYQLRLMNTLIRRNQTTRSNNSDDERVIQKQDRQALLKANYCPRAMPVQHFVNPSRMVQAALCTKKTKPMWPWPLTHDLDIQ